MRKAKSTLSLMGFGLAALSIAGCQIPEQDSSNWPGTPPLAPAPPPGPDSPTAIGFASSGDSAFDKWRADFSAEAQAAGRERAAIISVLSGLSPLEERMQVASFEQAEFVKPIWDYAQSALSSTRISRGRTRLTDNAEMFSQIERTYAPPREIVTAIWGMESSYGGFIGTFDAPRTIATQASQGRRKNFYEDQLLAIMQLIEDGSATREQFKKASWAGAVGQTQFMPTTFLAHARDYDRDGRKDLWTNHGDALASAANYLTASGWREDEPWVVETTIPENFDYSLGDGRKMSVAAWKGHGLTPATQASFAPSDSLQAELFLPAGSYGPAFLLFHNFNVIKRYNNADSYALAIGLLADQLANRPQLSRDWPSHIKMLTPAQAKSLQSSLNSLGYSAGVVDGIIGRNTRKALQGFQKDRGLVADGFPTVEMLNKVQAAL